jgi:hypothetical protein
VVEGSTSHEIYAVQFNVCSVRFLKPLPSSDLIMLLQRKVRTQMSFYTEISPTLQSEISKEIEHLEDVEEDGSIISKRFL